MGIGIAVAIGQLASSLISSAFDNGGKGKKPDITGSGYSRFNNELNSGIQEIEDLPVDTSKSKEEITSELSSSFIGKSSDNITDLYSVIESSSRKSIEASYEVKRGLDSKLELLNENLRTLNENVKSSIQSQQAYGSLQSEMTGQLANPKGPLSGLFSTISSLGSTILAPITAIASVLGLAGWGIGTGISKINEYITGGKPEGPGIIDEGTQKDFESAETVASEDIQEATEGIVEAQNQVDEAKGKQKDFKSTFGISPARLLRELNLNMNRGNVPAYYILEDGVSKEEQQYLRDNGLPSSSNKTENDLYLLSSMQKTWIPWDPLNRAIENARMFAHSDDQEFRNELIKAWEEGFEARSNMKEYDDQLKAAKKDLEYAEQYQKDVEESKQLYADYKIYDATKDLTQGGFMEGSDYKGWFESDEHALDQLREDLTNSTAKGKDWGTSRSNIISQESFIEDLVSQVANSGAVSAIQNSIGNPENLTDAEKQLLQKYGILDSDGKLKPTTLAEDATTEQLHDYWNTMLGYLDYSNDRRSTIFNAYKGGSDIDHYLLRYLSGELGGILDENGELVTTDNMPRLLRALDQLSNPYSTEDSFTFTNQDFGDQLSYLGMEFNSQHNLDDSIATQSEITNAINKKFDYLRDDIFEGQTISVQDTKDIIAFMGANLNASDSTIIAKLQELIDKPDTPTVVISDNGMSTD